MDRPATGQNKPRVGYIVRWGETIFQLELQKPFWTIDDGVPILLGLSTVIATPELIAAYRLSDIWAFEAMRLRRLVADAQLIGDLPSRIRPPQFINWALAQHIPVPPKLIALALERGLPIIGHTSPVDAWKKRCAELIDHAEAAERTSKDKIAALEAERRTRSDEMARLRLELKEVQKRLAEQQAPQSTEPPQEKTNTSGQTRKYNVTSMLLFGVAKAAYGVEFTAMKKPNLKKLLAALESVGMNPDDETLEGHLRNGAEQAARTAKSLK
jgi:regulator of replication initiation timing